MKTVSLGDNFELPVPTKKMFCPENYGMAFEDVSDDSETSEKEKEETANSMKKRSTRSTELKSKFEQLKDRRQGMVRRAELKKKERQEEKERKLKKKEEQRMAEKRKLEEEEKSTPNESKPTAEAIEKRWSEIRAYIDVNRHLNGVDHGQYASKTGLEKQIDAAIKAGDVSTSEKLSDQLASREFGKKVSDAFQAEAWMVEKEKQKAIKNSKKTKKLKWGCVQYVF
ncbi:hypothetical protein CAPTEDRAFT_186093 [Capitella teleta]|uniref:Uncharacterized protein n=1 Tax=Capitella teleta TaxID=283909 RepID=R7TNS0_CAPTE|nr:hypothetical protein CAPTEDRAFT_186093 [Capitella teleta]|eukprot:ELT95523.1 hypothetical protein CAPTEDRAFT_186093 [Capitella teleta]